MTLKIHNTLTRKKETFRPINKKHVNFFVCGPTVYDYSHIGHAKTYTQFDMIVKYLRYRKFDVFYLQNITDIDDKIINRARELGKSPKDVAELYLEKYLEDMQKIGINSVNKYAKATDYISQIVSQVKRLIKKSYAYKISDGIYFDLSKDKDYGKLAARTSLSSDDAVSRIDENAEKRNKGDFCLWKFHKEWDPFWETEIGKGRPGWHIEDTAITEEEFGVQYDVHGGARDLIFPHHEAEIAQMESISGKKPFVKYWLHTEFLNIAKAKMSKSLGNMLTIRQVLERYDPKVLRYFFVSSHYRSPIYFDYESLEHAKNALQRLNDFVLSLRNGKDKFDSNLIKETKKKFIAAMDDDFDTPTALAAVFDFVREVNKKGGGEKALKLMLEFDSVFNILTTEEVVLDSGIARLIEQREQARSAKDFRLADNIREELKRKGIILEDTKEGVRWKRG